jgi:hypothetical protein
MKNISTIYSWVLCVHAISFRNGPNNYNLFIPSAVKNFRQVPRDYTVLKRSALLLRTTLFSTGIRLKVPSTPFALTSTLAASDLLLHVSVAVGCGQVCRVYASTLNGKPDISVIKGKVIAATFDLAGDVMAAATVATAPPSCTLDGNVPVFPPLGSRPKAGSFGHPMGLLLDRDISRLIRWSR